MLTTHWLPKCLGNASKLRLLQSKWSPTRLRSLLISHGANSTEWDGSQNRKVRIAMIQRRETMLIC